MDNPLEPRWPLYTRGNVGEVFPEVVLPFSWDLLGQAAEDGWRDGFQRLGIVADGDFAADEPMVILGVFGGYCYINASYVRMLGVRTPGASVDQIDLQFFGESDAPAYAARPDDRSRRARCASVARSCACCAPRTSPCSTRTVPASTSGLPASRDRTGPTSS